MTEPTVYDERAQAIYTLRAEVERLREALREVMRRAEGANARAQWVAEPARDALSSSVCDAPTGDFTNDDGTVVYDPPVTWP